MATTTTALMPSPSLKSAFSPYTESPSSPAQFALNYIVGSMQNHTTSTAQSESLAPPPSPYPATVDPSPVESTNSASTEATDIEVDGPHLHIEDLKSPDIAVRPPQPFPGLPHPILDTDAAAATEPDDGPQSVIHAPKGFKQFHPLPTHQEVPSPQSQDSNNLPKVERKGSPSGQSEHSTVRSPDDANPSRPVSINTHVPPTKPGAGSTPKAATQEEADLELRIRRARNSKNLEDVLDDDFLPEDPAFEGLGATLKKVNSNEKEVASLRAALSECWNLCNSLAILSASHRERMFNFTGNGEIQEQAWRTCWRLCQKLYESRDEEHAVQVKPTLELCRDFCQALFEARDRGDEIKDSILRVSFELNNHLYNTQHPNPSLAVMERTLEFYLTICHRLMKDQTSLPDETDHLLRACWGLAESLFSLRQIKKDQQSDQEELFSSAVEACLELCDLFREGWTQLRPDRGTPRALQRQFGNNYPGSSYSQSTYQASHTASRPASAMSFDSSYRDRQLRNMVPETPTTIFDDRDDLSSIASPGVPPHPYISVMNADLTNSTIQSRQQSLSGRWPSSASVSGYSESSARTVSSSRTPRGGAGGESSQTSPKSVNSQPADTSSADDPNIVRIKALILKVAMNKGYQRSNSAAGTSGSSNSPQGSLQTFVRALPPTSFGNLAWQTALFDQYRRLVLNDAALQDPQSFPRNRRFTPSEVAKAVIRLARSDQYKWLPSLYTLVFGFEPEDSSVNKAPGLQV